MWRLTASFLALASLPCPAQRLTAVRLGKLWDGEKVIERPLVVIERGRIRSVQAGNPAPPAGAEVVDWSRYYGLPGLIDVHTHMTYVTDGGRGVNRGGQRMAAVTVSQCVNDYPPLGCSNRATGWGKVKQPRDIELPRLIEIMSRPRMRGYITGLCQQAARRDHDWYGEHF